MVLHQGQLDEEAIVCVGSIREIMQDCVLKFVRGLYPNPESQPYMGHKWH